jgi:dolichol kinase
MNLHPDPPRPEIPFSQELLRKATHLGALIIPGGYWVLGLTKQEALLVLIPSTVVMVLLDYLRLKNSKLWRAAGVRLIGRMIRTHEAGGDFTGATYILISAASTVALFDKPIAIAALAFIIIGDTLAALIGRLYGKHRFGRKSIEGSLGCLVGTLLVAVLVPHLQLAVAVPGAVIATVVEALSTKIDDNISVPLISGVCMTLIQKVIVSA